MPIKYVDEKIIEDVITTIREIAKKTKQASIPSLEPLPITATGIFIELSKVVNILEKQLTDYKIGASFSR